MRQSNHVELVVVAVGVVVAALRAQHLVAAEQHRRAGGEDQLADEVLRALPAEAIDRRIVGLALGAGVPRQVVVGAVAVVLAVGVVVLLVVADEIPQREAVVARDEVDGVVGGASVVGVEIARARESVAELA